MRLNHLVAKYETKDFVIVYVPYRHGFFLFSPEEWKEIQNGKETKYLKEKRIIVEEDYKEKFLKHYQDLLPKPELNIMYLLLTDSCNFRCPYCFIEDNFNTEKRTFMSEETAKTAIDYFYKNCKGKELKIIFYGGEPTLNEEVLIKSIEHIRKNQPKDKKLQIGINTNGSNYTEELSEAFKKNEVLVSISLDSFPEINDKTRINTKGEGQSTKILENTKNYIADGVNVSLSITINGHNIDYLPAFAKYICQELPEIKGVGFNLPLESKKGNPLFVDPEYTGLQIYNSFRIFRKYGVYEDRVLRRLKHMIGENIYLKDCGACGNQIAISPEGFAGPCHGLVGLKKDFKNLENLDFYNDPTIKKWNSYSPVNRKECSDCPYMLICGNSCPYYSYITKGDLNAKDERMKPFLDALFFEIGKDKTLNSKIKHILVDFDGTAISRKPTREILNTIAKEIGSKYAVEKQDYYDVRDLMTKIIKESNQSEEDLNNLLYRYLKLWKETSIFNKPLLEQLKKIKERYPEIKIHIASNSKSEDIIKELGENTIFDNIFGKDNLGIKKSEAGYFASILKILDSKSYETMYIGDAFKQDIKPFWVQGTRIAVSFYANPLLFHRLENDWLVDMIEDVQE